MGWGQGTRVCLVIVVVGDPGMLGGPGESGGVGELGVCGGVGVKGLQATHPREPPSFSWVGTSRPSWGSSALTASGREASLLREILRAMDRSVSNPFGLATQP